jgi:protease IV
MDDSFSSPGAPPPPPIIVAPQPPQRRGRGWMIFAIILIVLLCFSLFGNFTQFISRAFHFGNGFNAVSENQAGPHLEEAVLKDNDSNNKIAVITVNGIITGHEVDDAGNNPVEVIKAELARAKKDSRVKAVILRVDSPGGEVMASDEIYRAIKKFQDESGKPVICSMGSLAASGGYYISSPCRWIEANQLTITGSIGVILETINFRGLMDKIGVEPVVYKSGKYKDMLSGMRETNEIPAGEHVMVQNLIDQTYDRFKSVVAEGRKAAHEKNKGEGRALAADWAKYADGRVLSGEQALQLGFVDELGDFQDAVNHAKKIADISSANLIEYRERRDLSDFLSMFGQSESARSGNIKLNLGFDMPKLQAGQLYFLYLPMSD